MKLLKKLHQKSFFLLCLNKSLKMSRPYLLTSVYLNDLSPAAAAAAPPPATVTTVWQRPLTDVSFTAGVFDDTPTIGCRMLGSGTTSTDNLGVFHLSGILVTTGVGGGGATWNGFLPPLAAAPATFGSFMAIENPGAALLPGDISVSLAGSVTLGGGNSLAAGSYAFSFTIACRLSSLTVE